MTSLLLLVVNGHLSYLIALVANLLLLVVNYLSPVPIGVGSYPKAAVTNFSYWLLLNGHQSHWCWILQYLWVQGINFFLLAVIYLSPVPIGVGSYTRAAVTNFSYWLSFNKSPVPIGVGSYSISEFQGLTFSYWLLFICHLFPLVLNLIPEFQGLTFSYWLL